MMTTGTSRSTVAACICGTLLLAACGSSGAGSARSGPRVRCATAPVRVVVSVDQWGDIVDQLAGDCGAVTTIFKSTSADPHDYEPSPADSATFTDAQLVVVNGLDYDPWATKAVAALDHGPAIVNGGSVVGLKNGDNPHLWYGPEYVTAVADAVTAKLKRLAPKTARYFEARHAAWTRSMRPYFDEVARLKTTASGTTYGATEGIFFYMARAIGLVNRTPTGYRHAADNASDPAPGDIHAFEQALAHGTMALLIYNRQTQGAIPEQIRAHAQDSRVPVVGVTESVPPRFATFLAWQLSQLHALAGALHR